MDLAAAKVETHPIVRHDAGEPLGDVLEHDEWGAFAPRSVGFHVIGSSFAYEGVSGTLMAPEMIFCFAASIAAIMPDVSAVLDFE